MILVVSESGNFITSTIPLNTQNKRIFEISGYNSIRLFDSKKKSWSLIPFVENDMIDDVLLNEA